MALGLIQPQTEMNPWAVKAAGAQGFMSRLSENPGSLNLLEPSGSILACTDIALPMLQ